MDTVVKMTRHTVELYTVFPIDYSLSHSPVNSALKHVGHKMIMIIHHSVFLALARRKKAYIYIKRKMRGSQQTASLWGESLELYYQISTATTHPCGSKHAVLLCTASLLPYNPILRAHIVIFFSPIYSMNPNTWLHPRLASSLTDCLICSLMLSEMRQPFCGSLLWGWMRVSLPVRQEKEGQNGKKRKKWGSFMPNRREG